MKKLLIPLLALLILLTAASAQGPVALDEPITGEYTFPEGSAPEEALYVYRYRYPQVTGDEALAALINNTYAYLAEDALGFEVPMTASAMQPGDPQKVVEIDYRVTCLNDEYLSVCITKRVTVGGDAVEVISGHVYPLTGPGAGVPTNLPVLLGLLSPDEADEWLLTRQTNKADALLREMVWARILAAQNDPDSAFHFYDDLTFEELEAGFYPEEDFYLTEEGEPCFYFQPGTIAPEEEGAPLFVITLWDIEDEM